MPTLTKVYEDHDVARIVVGELESAGFPTSSISLLANKKVSALYDDVDDASEAGDDASEAGDGAAVGAGVGGAVGLLAGLGILAIPGLGPVVATGWLASTVVGAVAGGVAGGLVGALIDAGVPEDHAHVYSEAVRRGGTLLSVKVEEKDVVIARAILDRHTSVDPVRRGAEYRETGWKQFDPAASDYVPEGIEVERPRPAI
jgi:hypothetical protein